MQKLDHWKYQVHYDIRGAQEEGVTSHPQVDMLHILDMSGAKFRILESEPVSIADCWLFLIKADTPWLGKHFPSYVTHQGVGNDKEGLYK